MTDAPTEPPAKKPWGRTIHDLWLKDGEGIPDPNDPPRYGNDKHLHSAEWELLRGAVMGELCFCGRECPTTVTEANRIRGPFLRFITLGGDDQHPLHEYGVQIMGAFIVGPLDFFGATITQNLGLMNCRAEENINLQDCFAQTLFFNGSAIESITGDRLETTGEVFLANGFIVEGIVRLLGAKIGGGLNCSGGEFNNTELSLVCDGLKATGNIFLDDGFKAAGIVRLVGAEIGGDLACVKGNFLCDKTAINAQKSTICGAVHLDRGFLTKGEINLSHCTIGGTLSCIDATFSCKDHALFAPRVKVSGNVDLGRDCKISGQVSFQGGEISGDLIFTGGSFDRKIDWDNISKTTCINLRNTQIEGTLFWRDIIIARGELNLSGASCRTLNIEEPSWQKPSQIRLDNFTYRGFNQLDETTSGSFWKRWINRQPAGHLTERFRPKPYQQLADVLQSMGHEEEARVIRVERKKRQAAYTRLYERRPTDPVDRAYRHLINFWNRVQGATIAYGYRPGLAVIWLLGMVVIGAFIYQVAAVKGMMTPTHPLIYKEAVWTGDLDQIPKGKIPAACRENWVYPKGEKLAVACAATMPTEYSSFSAIVYSLDVAIPVVNFRMENDWSPRVVDWKTGKADLSGWLVRLWEWVQIILGWMFSLLFVSAIGGVIRRD